jgi:hemoglobin
MSGRSLQGPILDADSRERAERRARLAPGTAAGVTEEMIQALVPAFYAKVRRDPAIGPIFNARIADWDAHLAKLCDFWSSVTLMTGRFKGAPMRTHAELPALAPAHFGRWLELWRETVAETCPPEAAALFIAKAETIADSLQVGIALSRGETAPPPIPATAVAYSRTATFTETTVPAALLRAHNTKPGVWGRIHVQQGELLYRITDPRRPPYETLLTPDTAPGVVEPTILHEVAPRGPVSFFVEFHK